MLESIIKIRKTHETIQGNVFKKLVLRKTVKKKIVHRKFKKQPREVKNK